MICFYQAKSLFIYSLLCLSFHFISASLVLAQPTNLHKYDTM